MATDTERSSHKVYEKDQIGEVQIADEVVAIIAGLAATEVDGVDSLAGNMSNEIVGKFGMKNLSKGVKVDVTEEHVSVNISMNISVNITVNIFCFILLRRAFRPAPVQPVPISVKAYQNIQIHP